MFTRIRTINGRRYLYEETRWREGGKVCSRSKSLGPVDGMGIIRRQFPKAHGIDWDAAERQQLAHMKADDERRAEVLKELHAAFGLTLGPSNPVPIDKPPSQVDLTAAVPVDDEAGQENAPQGSEAQVSAAPSQ